jgi:hypothetical protein
VKKLATTVAFLVSISAQSQILSGNELVVDFTNSSVAITNASWSDNFSISTNGLGWDGKANENRDVWIQSIPVAMGNSWRPPRSVSITIEVNPQFPTNGHFFVRYSPDQKHWSSWQALEQRRGVIEVPQNERLEYDKLVQDYSGMDVPWKSDEEAAQKWILQQQPDFLDKHLPFVGYIQFRIEGSIPGGQRINKIRMHDSWGVSGLSSVPKNFKFDNLTNGTEF